MKFSLSEKPALIAVNSGRFSNTADFLKDSLEQGAQGVFLHLKGDSSSPLCLSGPDLPVPPEGKGLTLDQVLASYPDTPLILELCDDSPALTRAVCGSVVRADAASRVLLYSYHSRQLNIASKISPEIPAAFSISGVTGFYALFRTGLLFFRRKFSRRAILTTEFMGPSYVANQGLVQSAAERNIDLFIFGAEGSEQFRRLSEAGVSGFITSDISESRKVLSGLRQL